MGRRNTRQEFALPDLMARACAESWFILWSVKEPAPKNNRKPFLYAAISPFFSHSRACRLNRCRPRFATPIPRQAIGSSEANHLKINSIIWTCPCFEACLRRDGCWYFLQFVKDGVREDETLNADPAIRAIAVQCPLSQEREFFSLAPWGEGRGEGERGHKR